MDNYKNAYKEIYIILESLEKEEYKKIPKDLINVFYKNMNRDWNFTLNKKLELDKNNLLPETRAILYNIYKNYLAKEQEREEMILKELEEIKKEEIEKQKKFSIDVFDIKRKNKK